MIPVCKYCTFLRSCLHFCFVLVHEKCHKMYNLATTCTKNIHSFMSTSIVDVKVYASLFLKSLDKTNNRTITVKLRETVGKGIENASNITE